MANLQIYYQIPFVEHITIGVTGASVDDNLDVWNVYGGEKSTYFKLDSAIANITWDFFYDKSDPKYVGFGGGDIFKIIFVKGTLLGSISTYSIYSNTGGVGGTYSLLSSSSFGTAVDGDDYIIDNSGGGFSVVDGVRIVLNATSTSYFALSKIILGVPFVDNLGDPDSIVIESNDSTSFFESNYGIDMIKQRSEEYIINLTYKPVLKSVADSITLTFEDLNLQYLYLYSTQRTKFLRGKDTAYAKVLDVSKSHLSGQYWELKLKLGVQSG
jgi:hypothetical protein